MWIANENSMEPRNTEPNSFPDTAYRCLIVEDEPLAAEILTDYIRDVPFLQLVAVCTDALFALEHLQKSRIDLMFLDIHLPKLKGLEFLQSLSQPPRVILTTAYPDYALEGFDLNVMDYLLKPIQFSRFLKAVNRLHSPVPATPIANAQKERSFAFFPVGKKQVRIFLDEILYIESFREYIRITTAEQSILTRFVLGEMEEQLKENRFFRVHRSFLVALDKITAFTTSDVFLGSRQIPLGRSFKESVLPLLERHKMGMAAPAHKMGSSASPEE